MDSTQKSNNLKLVAIVKGCYIDNFGNLTSYQYRIFNKDTVETFINLITCELKAHPGAVQEICFMNQLNKHYFEKSIKGVN